MSNDHNTDRLNIQVHKTSMDSPMSSPNRIPGSSTRAKNDGVKGIGWNDCVNKHDDINKVINDLDVKLNRVLAK